MTFNTGAALLDAVVLAVVSKEGTYGYKITPNGMIRLDGYRREWKLYRKNIEHVLFGEN